jgi:hypothetical protein
LAKDDFTNSIPASRARATTSKIDFGEVGIDRLGLVHLGPHIEKDEVAFANFLICPFLWSIMRIAAMGADADDRRMVRRHLVLLIKIHDEILDVGFPQRLT